jgi:hypothetical protein
MLFGGIKMSETTKKTKKETDPTSNVELDPCVRPQSPESTRPNEDEDACDDGVK